MYWVVNATSCVKQLSSILGFFRASCKAVSFSLKILTSLSPCCLNWCENLGRTTMDWALEPQGYLRWLSMTYWISLNDVALAWPPAFHDKETATGTQQMMVSSRKGWVRQGLWNRFLSDEQHCETIACLSFDSLRWMLLSSSIVYSQSFLLCNISKQDS